MATSKIKFWREHNAVKDLLGNNSKLRDLEDDTILKVYNQVQAQFLVDFGVEGRFKIVEFTTTQGRRAFKISADDARTTAILKHREGWLAQFVK